MIIHVQTITKEDAAYWKAFLLKWNLENFVLESEFVITLVKILKKKRKMMNNELPFYYPEEGCELLSGWESIDTGLFVSDEDAFDYALKQCLIAIPSELHKLDWTQEFKEMLVEWFYSGNWVRLN